MLTVTQIFKDNAGNTYYSKEEAIKALQTQVYQKWFRPNGGAVATETALDIFNNKIEVFLDEFHAVGKETH